MDNIEAYREEFAYIAEGMVHLNHAGVSGMSRRTIERVREMMDRQSRDPIGAFGWIMEQQRQCRERLANLMGVSPDDLAFTKNTAHGLSIVADGLDWRPGDEVVFADCEYPANSYPWLAQADRGVICKVVPTRPDGTIAVEDYAAAFTDRTRILAVSWVQYSTGFRADLAAVTRLAHERGALIAADVIQGLGAFPLDLTALGVDIAATGSQKWLIGPMGVGGLYVHPDTLAHLRLGNMGSGSVKNAYAFSTLDLDPKPNAQRYEEGTPNTMGYCGLNAALEMLEEVGRPKLAELVLAVTGYTMEKLEQKGYLVDSPKEDASRSGIVMFHHPELPSEEIAKSLQAAKIGAVTRSGKIRFAPHFYNTEEDMDRAVAALP